MEFIKKNQNEKISNENLSTYPVRVSRTTKEKIMKLVARLNKEKKFGNQIKPDAVISKAVDLLEPKHHEELKEASMTHKDRFERAYQEYVKKQGPISKDEFYGILLSGQLASNSNKTLEKTRSQIGPKIVAGEKGVIHNARP